MSNAWLLWAALLLCTGGRARAERFTGRVTDGAGEGVVGARVAVNRGASVVTIEGGAFEIEAPRSGHGDVVTAAAQSHVTAALTVETAQATGPLVLALHALPAEPHDFIPWSTAECAACHTEQYAGFGMRAGFRTSAHAQSATNARVLDIYRGTASGRTSAASCGDGGGSWERVRNAAGELEERCYLGVGMLSDLNANCGHAGQPRCDDASAPGGARPAEHGDCAGCHAPGAAMSLPSEVDLDRAALSPAVSSVTCSACHRVAEVLDPNLPGVLRGARIVRGEEVAGRPLALGPLDDAHHEGMTIAYSPVFTESRVCAPCHQDTYHAVGRAARFPAGVPSEQTYEEWLESPYSSGPGARSCQSCHMQSLAALGITPSDGALGRGGPARSVDEVHTHDFSAQRESSVTEGAVVVDVGTSQVGDTLEVVASVRNSLIGHAFPSGVTSRNALLVLRAELAGVALTPIGGETLPSYAGSYASGIVSSAGEPTALVLDHAPPASALGRKLRVVRETSAFHEHVSFGVLRGLPLEEKGLHVTELLLDRTITAIEGTHVVLDGAPLDAQTRRAVVGATFYVGDSRRLAGAPGLGLCKVTVAADGRIDVPFWMATDLRWDNRLAPGETQRSTHRYRLPAGTAGEVTVSAVLVYRSSFVALAEERGWAMEDRIVGSKIATLRVDVPRADGGGCRTSRCGEPTRGEVTAIGAVLLAAMLRARRSRRRRF